MFPRWFWLSQVCIGILCTVIGVSSPHHSVQLVCIIVGAFTAGFCGNHYLVSRVMNEQDRVMRRQRILLDSYRELLDEMGSEEITHVH